MAARTRLMFLALVLACGSTACAAPLRPSAGRPPSSPRSPAPEGPSAADVLDCQGGRSVTGSIDYFTDKFGEAGDAVDVAKRHLPGLRSTDVVRVSGHPGQRSVHVTAVREGRVVAIVELDRARDGGWLVSTVSNCELG